MTAVARQGPGTSHGRTTRRYRRLAANQRARRLPCWLCGQPIDYRIQYPHPDCYTTDHALPWSTHPALREDPANLRSAHKRCNESRNNRTPRAGLGNTARQW